MDFRTVTQNAVIISDADEEHIRYHAKCQFCKSVDREITYGACLTFSDICENRVVCSKCGRSFTVRIGRSALK